MLVFAALMGYFLFLFKQVVSHEQYTVVNSVTKESVDKTGATLDLSKYNFDIAIYLGLINKYTSYQDDIDRYFYASIQRIDYAYVDDPAFQAEHGVPYWWNLTDQNLILCDSTRFRNMSEETASIGITDHHYCLKDDFHFSF